MKNRKKVLAALLAGVMTLSMGRAQQYSQQQKTDTH